MLKEQIREFLLQDYEPDFGPRFGSLVLEQRAWGEAIDLAFDPDPRIAFRASYALEYAYFAQPDQLTPYLGPLLQAYLTVRNGSAQRHYTKMLEHLLRTGRLELTAQEREQVAEVTFDHLIDPRTRVAVKVWAMEILFLLLESLPWVEEQLEETIHHLMLEGTPAMITRAGSILKRLARQRAQA